MWAVILLIAALVLVALVTRTDENQQAWHRHNRMTIGEQMRNLSLALTLGRRRRRGK